MTRDHPLCRSAAALMLLVSATALGADLELDPTYGLQGLGDTVGAYGDRLAGSSFGYSTFPPAQLLHPDGSVLFAGTDATGRMRVLRIAATGSVDRAFGREGTVEVPLGPGSPALALSRDGDLLVAGAVPGESACGRRLGLTPPSMPAGGTVAAATRVVKLRPDGTLDPAFGTAGIADIALPTLSGPPNVVRMAVERVGRIRIVAGCDATGPGSVGDANAVVSLRLDAAGRPDASFAIATTGRFGLPVTLALLDDDTAFVLAYEPDDELDGVAALHRFAADGRNGRRIADPLRSLTSGPLAIVASGPALYVAGQRIVEAGGQRTAEGAVLRLGGDGEPDRSFGVDGQLTLPAPTALLPGTMSMHAGGLAIDTDGSVLAAGAASTQPWGGNLLGGLLLTRFSAQGVLDRGVGRDGYAYVALPGVWYRDVALTRNAAGGLLLATEATTAKLRGLAPGAASASPGLVSVGTVGLGTREGDAPLTVRVYRTGGRRGAASVEYATRDGSAIAGTDYQSASGRLDWADSDDTPRSIELRVLDDAVVEPIESFSLELRSASGAQVGAPSKVSVAISPAVPAAPSASGSGAGAASAGGGGGALGTATLAALLLLALAGARRRFSAPRSDTADRCRSDAPRRGSGRAGAATSGRNSRRGSRRRARSVRR